jgi:hypothetical protein
METIDIRTGETKVWSHEELVRLTKKNLK